MTMQVIPLGGNSVNATTMTMGKVTNGQTGMYDLVNAYAIESPTITRLDRGALAAATELRYMSMPILSFADYNAFATDNLEVLYAPQLSNTEWRYTSETLNSGTRKGLGKLKELAIGYGGAGSTNATGANGWSNLAISKATIASSRIASYCLYSCGNLTQLTLRSEGTIELQTSCVSECPNLSDVTLDARGINLHSKTGLTLENIDFGSFTTDVILQDYALSDNDGVPKDINISVSGSVHFSNYCFRGTKVENMSITCHLFGGISSSAFYQTSLKTLFVSAQRTSVSGNSPFYSAPLILPQGVSTLESIHVKLPSTYSYSTGGNIVTQSATVSFSTNAICSLSNLNSLVLEGPMYDLRGSVIQNCPSLENFSGRICASSYTYAFQGCNIQSLSVIVGGTLSYMTFTYLASTLRYADVSFIESNYAPHSAMFSGCSMLSYVKLNNVYSIMGSMFLKCSSLMTMDFTGMSFIPGGGSLSAALSGTPMRDSTLTGSFGSIIVPSSLYTTWRNSYYWSSFKARIISG